MSQQKVNHRPEASVDKQKDIVKPPGHSGSHLTKDDRLQIEVGIKQGFSKKTMGELTGKDPTTIAKEIQLHRKPYSSSFLYSIDCKNYKACKDRKKYSAACCSPQCEHYQAFQCKRRDHTPGACNGCADMHSCHYQKYIYHAEEAHTAYRYTLEDARKGENLTTKEAMEIGAVLKEGLGKGQSIYHIVQNHPEINVCERTLYNYMERGTLGTADIHYVDLRRAAKRKKRQKMSKKTSGQYKKRKDNKHLIGRKYEDFVDFMEKHPDASILQMDTVYNNVSEGPFIQTFLIWDTSTLIGFLHDKKTSENMLAGINKLENILGKELFKEVAVVTATDRGSEFMLADEAEHDSDGNIRTHLFYCDPLASGQKGSLEQKHTLLRYVCAKGRDLRDDIGLRTQDDLNIVLSHIGSYALKELYGQSGLGACRFMKPAVYEALRNFGIVEIPADKVYLKEDLLKNEAARKAAQKPSSNSDDAEPQSTEATSEDSTVQNDDKIPENINPRDASSTKEHIVKNCDRRKRVEQKGTGKRIRRHEPLWVKRILERQIKTNGTEVL